MTARDLIGKQVVWKDPESISGGTYTVVNVNEDENVAVSEDTVILIADDYSEAEVTIDELTILN